MPAERRLAIAVLMMGAAQAVTHVLNYLFQLVVGRSLPPAVYGEFQSLLSVATVASLAIHPVSWLLSRNVAIANRDGERVWIASTLRRSLMVALALVFAVPALGAVSGIIVLPMLRIRDVYAMSSVGVYLGTLIVFSVPTAFLLGLGEYKRLNILNVCQSLFRFVFTWPTAVWIGVGLSAHPSSWAAQHSQSALFFAQALASAVVGAAATFWLLEKWPRENSVARVEPPYRLAWSDTLLTTMAQVSAAVFVHADLIYVQRNAPELMAAGYAGASVLGKVAVYLPTAVTTVVFPRLSGQTGEEARRLVSFAVRVAFATTLFGVAAISVAPEVWLTVLLGASYAAAGPILVVAAVVLAPGGLVATLLQMAVARKDTQVLWLIVVAGVTCVAILLVGPAGLGTLFVTLSGTSASVFLLGTWILHRGTKSNDSLTTASLRR